MGPQLEGCLGGFDFSFFKDDGFKLYGSVPVQKQQQQQHNLFQFHDYFSFIYADISSMLTGCSVCPILRITWTVALPGSSFWVSFNAEWVAILLLQSLANPLCWVSCEMPFYSGSRFLNNSIIWDAHIFYISYN